MSEGRELARARMEELNRLSVEELLHYDRNPSEGEVTGQSGRRYLLRITAWDDDEDGPTAQVRVHGTGWRRFQRWTGRVHEPGAEYPEEARRGLKDLGEISTRTGDYAASAGCVVIGLLLVAPWFVGVGFLISLLF